MGRGASKASELEKKGVANGLQLLRSLFFFLTEPRCEIEAVK